MRLTNHPTPAWERRRDFAEQLLCAHRTIPACQPECALQGRETVMTLMIGVPGKVMTVSRMFRH
jgi:hypothetical protein